MRKIFLAEDDPTLKLLLKTLLELEDCQVTLAIDSLKEGIIEQITNLQPDIILMDIHLKRANGIEVLTALRKDPRVSSIRVLATSGEDLSDQCLQNGADGFLLKPYMPDELIQWIREH